MSDTITVCATYDKKRFKLTIPKSATLPDVQRLLGRKFEIFPEEVKISTKASPVGGWQQVFPWSSPSKLEDYIHHRDRIMVEKDEEMAWRRYQAVVENSVREEEVKAAAKEKQNCNAAATAVAESPGIPTRKHGKWCEEKLEQWEKVELNEWENEEEPDITSEMNSFFLRKRKLLQQKQGGKTTWLNEIEDYEGMVNAFHSAVQCSDILKSYFQLTCDINALLSSGLANLITDFVGTITDIRKKLTGKTQIEAYFTSNFCLQPELRTWTYARNVTGEDIANVLVGHFNLLFPENIVKDMRFAKLMTTLCSLVELLRDVWPHPDVPTRYTPISKRPRGINLGNMDVFMVKFLKHHKLIIDANAERKVRASRRINLYLRASLKKQMDMDKAQEFYGIPRKSALKKKEDSIFQQKES